MAIIHRKLQDRIDSRIQSGKVIVIAGARRTGKTVLLKEIMKSFDGAYLYLNGEDYTTELILQNKGIEEYKNLIGNSKYLVIDEAQKIENIGQILKLMIDEIEGLHIIITGSSAFDLSNNTGEPLTGRKYTFQLHPVAQCELMVYENPIETESLLENRLIYGSYPEILSFSDNQQKSDYLTELINSYLLKDILTLDSIKNSAKLVNILRLLAFQVGNVVSVNELAQNVGLNKLTVERYLDLLTKVFVIYRIEGYSRNLRKEISKSPRYYFWDNGIRNTLVANFNPLVLRNDVGQLWENYVISERIKLQHYQGWLSNNYFWRTYDQQEIDWIEERDGNLFAFEMKYQKKNMKAPGAWTSNYPGASFDVISRENYVQFITQKE
ncbi:MAG TPA: ATP-binding protein [Draconibacterium sp.]|nr:ATP-binding protein [Draconibacterium sp.]